jgi:Fe-S cluster biogenesis protein NfuA
MKEKIEEALKLIKPALQADGGDVELIDFNNGVAKLKLTGACGSCPMASLTLKNMVERTIRENVPEIREVIAV